ncbi:MBL fold metallo-hydrolase [Rhodococcus sp. NPDC049939]|uniref:MBL fold metallo-hydrolase n=1 Tax=Rhodococcus sp. NPDC049939 TaxID=3155511 RepID=UPI0033E4163F
MPFPLCATCGVEQDPHIPLPDDCAICADERQYIPLGGQVWTTVERLSAEGHRVAIREVERGLHGLHVEPRFAIGQQSLLVCTPEGSLLWDPIGFVDEAAIDAVSSHGPVIAVAASHPHMFGVQTQWSKALGDVPILVADADRSWLARSDGPVVFWSGTHEVASGLTLHQIGGHFPGSAVAHWRDGADGRGVLLTGDGVFPNPDRRTVSFLRSYPNRLPLSAAVVRRIADQLSNLEFDRIIGNFDNAIEREGPASLEYSAARHCAWVIGEFDNLT